MKRPLDVTALGGQEAGASYVDSGRSVSLAELHLGQDPGSDAFPLWQTAASAERPL